MSGVRAVALLGAALLSACKSDSPPATVDPSKVQTRVTGTCGSGQFMTGVNQDGTVACASDASGAGDVTGVAAGLGLTGGGTEGDVTLAVDAGVVQSRVSATCAEGSSIREIDASGQVTCEPDDDHLYEAGGGLLLASGVFSVDGSVVARKDSAAGDQTFDGGTLHLDYANDRVGVGTMVPATRLDVAGTVTADAFSYRDGKTHTIRLPYSAFHINRNDTQARTDMQGYIWLDGNQQSAFDAPFDVPPGATITNVTCEIYDFDASNDFEQGRSVAYLEYRPAGSISFNMTTFIVFLNTTGAANEIQTRTASSTHVVDADADYWVRVFIEGSPTSFANLRFYGCRVTYTTTEPW